MQLPPWSPTAISGEEYHSRPPFLRFALFLWIARILTGLGLVLVATAPWWAGQWQKPLPGFYIMGGALTLLGGAWWFVLVWHRPPAACLVLGGDRLQLQHGWAEVVDEVHYRNIQEVAVLRYPRAVGGTVRGLALRLIHPEEYLKLWPIFRPRWQRTLRDTGYDWLLSDIHIPFEAVAARLREKMRSIR